MIIKKISAAGLHALKALINTQFICWDSLYEPAFSRAYGCINLHTSKGNVDVTNYEQCVPFFDITEDISGFDAELSANIHHDPGKAMISIPVNEPILDILITTDTIDVHHGEYQITFDMAVTIVTSKHRYMFSRGYYFDEMIYMNTDQILDEVYPVSRVIQDWDNDGEYDVCVQRETRSLSAFETI